MTNFFRGIWAVVTGLMAVIFGVAGATEIPNGDLRITAGSILFVIWFGSLSWVSVRGIRAARKKFREDLDSIVGTLETRPYEQAVSFACEQFTPFPNELVLRKFNPAHDEWKAFEWKTKQFVVGRVGATSETKVTFIS